MPDHIELDHLDFITVNTIGPKGKRVFHLQAGRGDTMVTFIMEKEQTHALAQAIEELFDELGRSEGQPVNLAEYDMALREPIEPQFRIAQMGLGYDQERHMIVLVVQELVLPEDVDAIAPAEPRIARLWGTLSQMRALSQHAANVVEQGRADPKKNGRVIYYWL